MDASHAGAIAEGHVLFSQFKAALDSGDLSAARALLVKLKLKLTEFPALPPTYQQTSTAQEELLLARDVLENAVLLSVLLKDQTMCERNYMQLRTYYTDTRELLPPSAQESALVGLNLLRLLVQNRIAEFHTELELLPASVQESACVRAAVEVEQCLMEGAYARVLNTRQNVPHPSFNYFMDLLMDTVRDEIASSSEKAYETLPVAEACRLLMLTAEAELAKYATQRSWEVRNGVVRFCRPQQQAPREHIPAMQLVSQALGYARELERIV